MGAGSARRTPALAGISFLTGLLCPLWRAGVRQTEQAPTFRCMTLEGSLVGFPDGLTRIMQEIRIRVDWGPEKMP